ncbi:hypothetical protein [Brevibacterium album]|uniref:phage tail tube protein n=1 Tax=Brevibacterium album TaxID=417948 RepID=UPI00040A5782|nr:hypothetical protein [Brevibacterium album]
MAFNDDAVIKIATAHFYTAPVGTDAPTDPANPGAEWENVGHTTLENILSMTTEGGERTVLGSLQNRNLKTSHSARQVTFNFSIHQFDADGIKLYLGANAVTEGGRIGPADTPAPTQRAFYVCVEDGDQYTDFYVPRADILGSDDLALADTESLASLPLGVTPLRMNDRGSAWYTSPVAPLPTGGTENPGDGS